jgi:hypothetical protein
MPEDRDAQTPLGAVGLALQSFTEPFRHPADFVPVFVVGAILYVATALLGPDVDPAAPPPALAPALTAFAASILLSALYIAWAATTAADVLAGNARSMAERGAMVLRNLLPVMVFFVLVAVLTGVGALLLLLPGLYVNALFLPWIATTALEDRGWSGLDRAMALTDGYRWPLVGASVILFIAMAAVVLAFLMLAFIAFPTAPPGDLAGPPVAFLVLASLLSVYTNVVGLAVFPAMAYVRLREIKEGRG